MALSQVLSPSRASPPDPWTESSVRKHQVHVARGLWTAPEIVRSSNATSSPYSLALRWPAAWSAGAPGAEDTRSRNAEFGPHSGSVHRPDVGVTHMSGLASWVLVLGVADDLKEVLLLGTLLFIVLVILVLAVLLGAGGYSVRRYWSPAGSEVVETSETTGGAGAGIAAAILALLVLILLFFGFTQWNWFGARQGTTPAINNPTVASPATVPGGGAPAASPAASPTP